MLAEWKRQLERDVETLKAKSNRLHLRSVCFEDYFSFFELSKHVQFSGHVHSIAVDAKSFIPEGDGGERCSTQISSGEVLLCVMISLCFSLCVYLRCGESY